MSPFTPEAQLKGTRAAHESLRRRTSDRVEDFDFLVGQDVPVREAAVRAGWSTLGAAARTLYRLGHPKAGEVERARKQQNTDPKHVSEVMGEFLNTLGGPRG